MRYHSLRTDDIHPSLHTHASHVLAQEQDEEDDDEDDYDSSDSDVHDYLRDALAIEAVSPELPPAEDEALDAGTGRQGEEGKEMAGEEGLEPSIP